MIIVTGGAGLIGSAVVWELNQRGITDIVIVDHLRESDKWKNLVHLQFSDYVDKADFISNLNTNTLAHYHVKAMIHLGACSNTMETNADYLMSNNFDYTKQLAEHCVKNNIRFIYASSAATYGKGVHGYQDNETQLTKLEPLNMYGYSKHLFDLWAQKKGLFDEIVGLKYFNVYGPNEYHKKDMRSLVLKAFYQIRETGRLQLFKSYRSDYADGQQQRDFLYVKDAVNMTLFFLDHPKTHGIYNIGSSVSRSWNDLAASIFASMQLPCAIDYIDMPQQIRDKYQYFTQADISKLKNAGYIEHLFSLEAAVSDYVQGYLLTDGHLQ